MALRKGEVYRCPDANCGCEITVTKGAPEGCKGQEQPRCCCGTTMEKVSDQAKMRERRFDFIGISRANWNKIQREI